VPFSLAFLACLLACLSRLPFSRAFLLVPFSLAFFVPFSLAFLVCLLRAFLVCLSCVLSSLAFSLAFLACLLALAFQLALIALPYFLAISLVFSRVYSLAVLARLSLPLLALPCSCTLALALALALLSVRLWSTEVRSEHKSECK
jgi:hypothetical protein